jgi:SAM-dependent methyltransferase
MSHREVERLYDEYVAGRYDEDPYAILGDSRAIALEQVLARGPLDGGAPRVLDLALGTGGFLLDLARAWPAAKLCGIDISGEMIQAARRKAAAAGTAIDAIHDDAQHLSRHVEPGSLDLVAVHFLFAYVDPRALVPEIARALRPGGHCSIATSTLDSFRNLQAIVDAVLPKGFFDANVPTSPGDLRALLAASGMEVVTERIHRREIRFADFAAFYDFGVPTGWFTEWILKLDKDMERTLREPGCPVFPFDDAAEISVLLARKLP